MNHTNLILKTPDGRTHTMCCLKILRRIEGRRTVFDAIYEDRGVIVKRFEDVFSVFRCRREKRGLERLTERGLETPKVLLFGKDSEGCHILIIEKIDGAADVLSAIKSVENKEDARKILVELFRYLARMHQAGVVQYDLHPGNYLRAEGRVCAIDPARMAFRKNPISFSESHLQLAMLMTSVPVPLLDYETAFLRAYCDVRGMVCNESLTERVRLLTARYRKRKLPHTLKKTLRNCKEFLVLKESSYYGVFFKQVFDTESARQCIAHLAATGRCDKANCTMTTYQPKHWTVALCWRLFGSPARRDWLTAWKNRCIGQSGGQPAAMIEHRTGLLVRQSWFVAVTPSRTLKP